jgi:hypothetical protein
MYDSGGVLSAVPLPISLIVCALGALLLGRFLDARPAFLIGIAFAAALLIAEAATGGWSRAKLVQNAQYLLPLVGLALGFMWRDVRTLAWTWLAVVAVFVPLQITFGYWNTGLLYLHHDVGLFSIYQHRQFVPVFFVGAVLVALFALWGDPRARLPLWIATGFVAFYVGLAISTLPAALLIGGAYLFSRNRPEARKLTVLALALLAVGVITVHKSVAAQQKYALFEPHVGGTTVVALPFGLPPIYVPVNIERRLYDWRLFGGGMMESGKAFAFGHAEPMDRSVSTSAHNYYLDLGYNAGLIALLPILALIAYTTWLLARRRLDPELHGLALVVLFVLVVDDNFKVTLKQPYPGVLTFFLWGVLLAQLLRTEVLASY